MTLAFLQSPIRFASGPLACLLLATLVGLANAETPMRLDAIVGAGVLRVGLTEDYLPFSFADASGKVEGIDVDMAMSLAQSLGVRLDIVKTSWPTLKSDLEANNFDIAMGGITITPDRQRLLAWSVPYLTTTLSLLVDLRRSPANMTLADLKGGTVGVQAATTDYDVAVAMQRAGQIGNVKVYPFAKIGDAIKDLSSGRVDAVMKVYPVAAWFVRKTPGLRILAQVPDAPQPLGIGFRRRGVVSGVFLERFQYPLLMLLLHL